MIGLIWAQDSSGAIGKDGRIPWHIPEDLKRFRNITKNSVVVMGRKTWESLPTKPLPHRTNIVITRQNAYQVSGAQVCNDVNSALLRGREFSSTIWVIGGAEIYEQSLLHAQTLVVTELDSTIDSPDAFAPSIPESFVLESSSGWMESETADRDGKFPIKYRFKTYVTLTTTKTPTQHTRVV